MPKILITGNGFDLYHGLPTKYGHFIYVMNNISKLKSKSHYNFIEIFDNSFQLKFQNDYESLKNNFHTDKVLFEINNLLELQQNLRSNSWFNYFLNKLNLDTWIDFETEISKVIEDLSIMFDVASKRKGNFNYYQKDLINVFTDFNPFKFVKTEDLTVEIESKFWIGRENRLNEVEIFKIFNDDLNGFTFIFNEYLQKIVNPLLKFNKCSYVNIYNQFERVFTFNYTKTISIIHNYPEDKVSYLHGKSDSVNQNIVIGVSDINENLKRLKLFNISKYYQKIVNDTNISFLSNIDPKKINEQIIFYVFGHSMDESDKLYIKELFVFISQESKLNSKVVIFYISEFDKEKKLNNILSIINSEKIIELNREKKLEFIKLNDDNLTKIRVQKLHKNKITIG